MSCADFWKCTVIFNINMRIKTIAVLHLGKLQIIRNWVTHIICAKYVMHTDIVDQTILQMFYEGEHAWIINKKFKNL